MTGERRMKRWVVPEIIWKGVIPGPSAGSPAQRKEKLWFRREQWVHWDIREHSLHNFLTWGGYPAAMGGAPLYPGGNVHILSAVAGRLLQSLSLQFVR